VQTIRICTRDLHLHLAKCLLRLLALVIVEALDEQDTVEVVHLVLENASFKLVSFNTYFIAIEIVANQVNGVGA